MKGFLDELNQIYRGKQIHFSCGKFGAYIILESLTETFEDVGEDNFSFVNNNLRESTLKMLNTKNLKKQRNLGQLRRFYTPRAVYTPRGGGVCKIQFTELDNEDSKIKSALKRKKKQNLRDFPMQYSINPISTEISGERKVRFNNNVLVKSVVDMDDILESKKKKKRSQTINGYNRFSSPTLDHMEIVNLQKKMKNGKNEVLQETERDVFSNGLKKKRMRSEFKKESIMEMIDLDGDE